MKNLFVYFSLVALLLQAKAGPSSVWSGGPPVVLAESVRRPVATVVTLPADFVSVPINVVSDQKNTPVAYEESRQVVEMIRHKVKEHGKFRASTGVITLSEHRGGFGISGGSWSQPAARALIYLLVPLTKEREDIFAASTEAARFIETLRLPGKAKIELGKLQLAIENPEQHRTKLLGMIAEEIKKTREALGTQGSVKVEGLESSVLVRQADDRQVELFLNYSLSVTTEK
jgi:hypothetical protein